MTDGDPFAFIQDATDENFSELVVSNSSRGPVLVNFWSKKVGPCIRQYPVLEKLAQEFGGRFLLVNLNTDTFRQLAKEYGVTSLPTLKLFVRGEVAETRHGYQDESDMKYLLAKHLPRQSDKALTEAVRVFQQGDEQQALVMLAEATIADPQNIRLPLTMARLMVSEGRIQEAEQLLASMPPEQRDDRQTRTLKGEIAIIKVLQLAPPVDELKALVVADTNDLEARYQLAAHYFVEGDYVQALGLFYEVVEADRQFQAGAAHGAIMTIFTLLGDEHELVCEYRSRLQKLIR